MNEGLMWLGAHRSDVLLAIMVVVVALNIYAFIRQQRTLVELRRLLLLIRETGIAPRGHTRSLVFNGVGHRYPSPRIVGGEHDDE